MNKLIYDNCASQEQARMSASPFMHVMDINRFENSNACIVKNGVVGGNNQATKTRKPCLVDLENDLMGRVRPATKCSEYQYRPNPNGTSQGIEYIKPVEHPVVDPSKFMPVPSCGVFVDRQMYNFTNNQFM